MIEIKIIVAVRPKLCRALTILPHSYVQESHKQNYNTIQYNKILFFYSNKHTLNRKDYLIKNIF